MMIIKHRFFLCLIGSMSLAACTTSLEPALRPSTPLEQKALPSKKSVETLTSWQLNGAIAAKKHKKAWSASLSWQQYNQNNYRIHLFGPLGGGNVIVEKKDSQVTYQDGQKISKSNNAQTLIAQEMGTELPVSHLFFWIRGLKAPGNAQTEYDAAGHLIRLHQAGYTLHYSNYNNVSGYDLPSKIHLENKDSLVKLVIKHWKPNV